MTVKRMVSGKHPITIRLSEEDYKRIKEAAFVLDVTPNAFIAGSAVEKAKEVRKE